MILYLDTSALVKLFLQEAGRDITIEAVLAATETCTSAIAYPEARSTFARKRREELLDSDEHARIVHALDARWRAIVRRTVTIPLAHHAGELAHRHGLRGYDAVHLATALSFDRRHDDLTFLAFDRRLNEAAQAAGLAVLHGVPTGDQP